MIIAIGSVANTVNVPHGLLNMALTTAIESPASVRIRMNKMATDATLPAALPISLSAITDRLRPLWRTEANSTIMSCTPPASTQPIRIHSAPGMKPNCAASTGPSSGPAAAMAAKW